MDNKPFGECLKDMRISAGKTVAEVSEYLTSLGYKASEKTIYSWESGRSQPTPDPFLTMCKFYGVTDVLSWFRDTPEISDVISLQEREHIKKYRLLDPYGKEAVDGVLDVEYRRCEAERREQKQAHAVALQEQKNQMETGEEIAPEGDKIIELPFDELKASAGTGYELDYDRLVPWKVIYNEMTRKADFCLEVDGRSMEPMIHDGDVILVRQQPSVDIGEIGLFTVGDKGFVKKQGDNRLISVNDAFEDISPGAYDVFFCRGKVIGVLDPDWIVEK